MMQDELKKRLLWYVHILEHCTLHSCVNVKSYPQYSGNLQEQLTKYTYKYSFIHKYLSSTLGGRRGGGCNPSSISPWHTKSTHAPSSTDQPVLVRRAHLEQMTCDEWSASIFYKKTLGRILRNAVSLQKVTRWKTNVRHCRTTAKELGQTASIPANSKLRLTKITYQFLSK